ncbi:hypothetical protein BJ944DRAFT_252053 [Cunninghamella echinulata]|nr:hypothetical protein BJ944DRAFT_252053 [Cunninghamella echinulata]
MKKILSNSRPNTILRIVLDERKYYYRGDKVRGHLVVVPTRPLKISSIQLQLIGRIRTYINSKKQDEYIYFKQPLPLDVTPGILKQDQTYTFTFDFTLPVDVSIPSCTESDTNSGGIIEYIIEASLEKSTRDWSSLTTSLHIPVLERLDISKSEMLEPVWDKITWQSKLPDDFIDQDDYYHMDEVTLSASLIHKGYIRNQKINVTVDIQHFQPYQRENGLTISLVRCTRILCKDKAYLLSPIVINSKKIDIDIQRTSGQTITASLLIPNHISPTINLNARLMQVDYRIEVKAELDEYQQYPTPIIHNHQFKQQTGVHLSCMKLELPIVIGTLPNNLSPPDILDPKFVKGINHFTQDNEPKQQPFVKSASLSSRPSSFSSPLDLLSLSLPKSPFSKNNHRYTTLKRNSTPNYPSAYRSQISLPPTVPPHLENEDKNKKYYKTIKTIDENDEEEGEGEGNDDKDKEQEKQDSEDDDNDEKDDNDDSKNSNIHEDDDMSTRFNQPGINLRLSLGEAFHVSPMDMNISRSTTYASTSHPKTSILTSTIYESKSNISMIQSECTTPVSSVPSSNGQDIVIDSSIQNQVAYVESLPSIHTTSNTDNDDVNVRNHIETITTTIQQNNDYLINHSQDEMEMESTKSNHSSISNDVQGHAEATIIKQNTVHLMNHSQVNEEEMESANNSSNNSCNNGHFIKDHTETTTLKTAINQTNNHLIDHSQGKENEEKGSIKSNHDSLSKSSPRSSSSSIHSIPINLQNKTPSPPLSPNQDIDDPITTTQVNKSVKNKEKVDELLQQEKLDDPQDIVSLSSFTTSLSKVSVDAGQQQQIYDKNENEQKHLSIGICRQVSVFSNYRQTDHLSPLPSPSENKKMTIHCEEQEQENVDTIHKPESKIDNLDIQGTYIEPILSPRASLRKSFFSNDSHDRMVLVNNNKDGNGSNEDLNNNENEDDQDYIYDKPHEIPTDDSDSDMYSDSDDEDFVTILARREKETIK